MTIDERFRDESFTFRGEEPGRLFSNRTYSPFTPATAITELPVRPETVPFVPISVAEQMQVTVDERDESEQITPVTQRIEVQVPFGAQTVSRKIASLPSSDSSIEEFAKVKRQNLPYDVQVALRETDIINPRPWDDYRGAAQLMIFAYEMEQAADTIDSAAQTD